MIEPIEEARRPEGAQEPDNGARPSTCRMFRLRRDAAGFSAGDLLLVTTDAVPEGGEFVIDWHGRLCRHGGGPVRGVIVGVVRGGAAARAAAARVRVGRAEVARARPRPAARRVQKCAAADGEAPEERARPHPEVVHRDGDHRVPDC